MLCVNGWSASVPLVAWLHSGRAAVKLPPVERTGRVVNNETTHSYKFAALQPEADLDSLQAMDDEPHRKQVRHYNHAGHAHMLTFSCFKRMPLLENDTWRTWLSEGINRTFEKQQIRLV